MIKCQCDETKPYIFVSYSHRDSKVVHDIIEEMYSRKYNIWFDEGIDPGTEWDQYIAMHVEKSNRFIAFVSFNYISSSNCKDELNYARDCEKERLIIYLEPVDLPEGMRMRLNRIQSIYKYKYRYTNDFYEKLFSSAFFNLLNYKKSNTNELLTFSTKTKNNEIDSDTINEDFSKNLNVNGKIDNITKNNVIDFFEFTHVIPKIKNTEDDEKLFQFSKEKLYVKILIILKMFVYPLIFNIIVFLFFVKHQSNYIVTSVLPWEFVLTIIQVFRSIMVIARKKIIVTNSLQPGIVTFRYLRYFFSLILTIIIAMTEHHLIVILFILGLIMELLLIDSSFYNAYHSQYRKINSVK